MKWIGQHIYDNISRFRDDVYLEDISSGTIASGGNLGLDSNNKIVKQSDTGITDLHGAGVDGSNNQLLTDDGDGTVTSEANLTFDGSTLALTGDLTVTGDTATFTSANADDPAFIIQNTTDDDQAARLQLIKNRGAAGQDDDNVSEFEFIGYNDAGTPEQIKFGKITCEIDDATDGEESGTMLLAVASHNGGMREFLRGTGGSQANETDVVIGNTATSLTTISGTLTMGSTATINNSGVIQVAAQTVIDHDQLANFAANEHFTQANITTVGTIDTGVWNGTAVASAYLDADTAHLSGSQTFTGTKTLNSFKGTGGATVTNILDEDAMGSNSDTALATQQSIKAYADTKSALATQKQLTFHSFTADIDTTKHYVGLVDADSEATTTTGIDMPLTFPVAAKLLQVTLRSNKNLSGLTYTWRLETQATGVGYGTGPTIVGTQSGAGPAQVEHVAYDFTSSLDSGDNVVDAFDAVYLSLQSGGATSNTKYFITCVWELDVSGY